MRVTPEMIGDEYLYGWSPPCEARRVHGPRRMTQTLSLVEVPVAILEHTLYWDFLYEVGLPMKPWRAVLATLSKMPGVEKYQADWRDTDVDAGTPIVVKIRRRRRRAAKVVQLAERREAS